MPPRKPWVESSTPIYICVCGFNPPTLSAQKRHRKKCVEWRDRADPRGMMIYRMRQTIQATPVVRCEICKRRVGRHAHSCPQSLPNASRKETATRAGLTDDQYHLLLAALKLMYPRGVSS